MISIHIRIIGLNHVGGVLKSLDQALFCSMQRKIHMCHIKGDFQCSSWRFFQYNEKISKKIYQKNPWKYLFQIFFFDNSNPPSIWGRQHLTKVWYLHFTASTGFAFQKKRGRILKVYPVLEILAHMNEWKNKWMDGRTTNELNNKGHIHIVNCTYETNEQRNKRTKERTNALWKSGFW